MSRTRRLSSIQLIPLVLLSHSWTLAARPTHRVLPESPGTIRVEARAGDSRSVLAFKVGGNYRLRIWRPSGSEETSINWRQPALVVLSWLVHEDGIYIVRCEPLQPSPSPHCELTLTETSVPTNIELETELRRGYLLLDTWSAAAHEEAERVFRGALARANQLGVEGLAVDSRLGLARALSLRGKPDEAASLLDEAVLMSRSTGDVRRTTVALVDLLQCLISLARVERAEEVVKSLLAETEGQDSPIGKADATLGTGDVHYHRSEFREAETRYSAAKELYQRIGDSEGVIDASLSVSYALMDQGRDGTAKPQLLEALALARSIGDRRREALILRVLGLAYSKLGESSAAIRYFELAQRLFEEAGDDASLVALYNGLGDLHRRVNDQSSALVYNRKASELARRTGFALGEVVALLGAGRSLHLLAEYEEALRAYETARTLATDMGHRSMQGAALAGMGNILVDRKEFAPGIEQLQTAVSMNLEAGNTFKAAEFLNDLSDAFLSTDRLEDAVSSSLKALGYAGEPPELVQQARALANLGMVQHRQGQLDEARRYLELALDVDEAMRLRVPGADLRALAFQGAQTRYGNYISLLMQIARENNEPDAPRLALEAVESSRSRVLLDSIRGTFGSPGPDDTDPVSKRQSELLEEVRKLALQADLEGEEAARGQTISERLAELRRLRGLQQEGTSADVNNQPSALPVDEIEAHFATGETLLLEFFLGEDRSYLWAVGGGRFEVHELAPESHIEERIRQAFGLLTARQQALEGSVRERARRNQENDDAFYREAASLSRELLGPITDIDRFSRLVVVSDGALNYFPIGVLAHPERSGPDAESYVPLLSTHEVVRAPSVTSMLALQARGGARSPREGIAILADPVFTLADPRIAAAPADAQAPRKGAQSAMDLNLRGSGRTLASLSRLLASREELAAIASVAPKPTTTATDFMADRATAERVLREPHRVVHFATHGVANDRYPELSGIVLSLVNEQGLPQDGFLRVQDISGLRVDADLVVLSACETALGHILRGEGITGMVTAFLRAGASGVVASKWKVDDIATQQLMEEFYRGLFLHRMDSAEALRAAQVSLWKRKRTQAPFYWGAFELHGIS